MINRFVFIGVRRVFDLVADERRSFSDRDRVLALYGPLCLILLPFVWITFMIIGFTLILWGLNVEPLRQAFILSGSSIFTLGFAAPTSLPIDLIVFFEAMIGLGLVALLISYLPSIYGAFARREQIVGGLEVRGGKPADRRSAARPLRADRRDGDGRQRAVQARGSSGSSTSRRRHTSLPRPRLLPLAATRAVVGDGGRVRARHRLARTADARPPAQWAGPAVHPRRVPVPASIADFFGIPLRPQPRPTTRSASPPRVRPARSSSQAAGVPLRPDREQAWRDFAGWRVNYDTVLDRIGSARGRRPRAVVVRSAVPAPKPKMVRRSTCPA